MAKRMKLEILGLSSSQSQSGSFALVLGEVGGNRRLPIIIGVFEAQAIAIEIEKISPNRPMTHDLFKTLANTFKYDVKEIFISDLKEGVFFAKMICKGQNGKVEIDSRPSDAIAIGLRFNVDIYTTESILEEAGIVLTEEVESSLDDKISKMKKPQKISDLSTEELKLMLEGTLSAENYEEAAKIRDELNKRN